MLRVAFTSEFRRGKLQDLVALLSGRNFETKQYEEAVAEEAFDKLKAGVLNFINKTHFDRLTMILRSAGFVTSGLIRSQNAINFAYISTSWPREACRPRHRALVGDGMSCRSCAGVTRQPETAFDFDIRQIEVPWPRHVHDAVIDAELPESFWNTLLPQEMDTSSASSPISSSIGQRR